MSKEVFSYYGDPISPTGAVNPTKNTTLREVWEKIRTDKTLQAYTQKLRTLILTDGEDKYKEEKKKLLPSVTFGGVFDYRSDNPEKLSTLGKRGLLSYSGLIIIDIDHISDGGVYTLEELTHKLSEDRELGLRLLFVSPSGDGLKLVCKPDVEIRDSSHYVEIYNSLRNYINNRYTGIVVDRSGRDVTRLCLLPYDPEALLIDREDTFHPEKHPVSSTKVEMPRRDYYTSTSPDVEDGVEEIVRRVEESGIDIAPTYGDYLPLVYSFTSLGERGKSLLHRVCRLSPKYNPEDTDRDWEECSKSTESQDIGYFINLCRDSGINVYDYNNRRGGTPYTPTEKPSGKTSQGKPSQTPTQEETQSPEEKYREFETIHNLRDVASTIKEGIKTGYIFKDSQGRRVEFVLPSGALTLVCGKSSHGKTRLLQNLSLHIAKEEKNKGEEGVVLYFAFEEGLLEVVERFTNIAVNKTHLSQYSSTTNSEVFRDYFQTGTLNKAPQDVREEVSPQLKDFESLYNEGRLRIYYSPDLVSGELCELLEYLSAKWRIKAVFLDYVQAIYKGDGYRKDRREELREICKELNKTAISLQIPIVLSAQLNRETPSPTEMSGDNIAESADITRYANTILLLWDSAKSRDVRGGVSSYLQTQEGGKLQEKGFYLGTPGKLYAVISKNRGGTPDVEALLEYVPETGKIPENDDIPEGDRPQEKVDLFNL